MLDTSSENKYKCKLFSAIPKIRYIFLGIAFLLLLILDNLERFETAFLIFYFQSVHIGVYYVWHRHAGNDLNPGYCTDRYRS